MPSQFSLLKTRRFAPLFTTQFFGAFNDNAFKYAIGILAIYNAGQVTGLSPKTIATAGTGIFVLPFFLFSAMAGQLADKYDKARMIRLVRFSEIPFMALAAAGFALQNYYILLGVLFCAGVQAAFFGPLKYSILPQHLKNEEIVGGNALVEAGTFIAILLGTIAGGTLILGTHGVAVVSAMLLAIALLGWATSLGVPSAPSAVPHLKVSLNFLSTTWHLTRHAARKKDVFLSIIGISWFWLVGSVFLTQFPIYANRALHANQNVVTLFLALFSIGIAVGALICNRLLKGRISGLYVPAGALGMAACIFLLWLATPARAAAGALTGLQTFAATPANWPLLLSLFGVSVFGGLYVVPLYAIMQTRCARSFRSRTIAVNNVMNALFMALGSVITIGLQKLHIGVTDIFLLMGAANIPAAALAQRLVYKRKAK